MAKVVAEYRYAEPLTAEQYARDAPRLADCLEVREARLVATYVSRDGTRRISVFDAADAESVRNAHRSANVRFESIWSAEAPS
ncbi:MAG TPA: nickel-binding protein [Polyangiaceae bacterium]|nr:nickel-binding protein [Polyangiaceae bacterium]